MVRAWIVFIWIAIFSCALANAQTTKRANVDSAGVQANGPSYSPALSATDGRYVAFESVATNLVLDDTNGVSDIFVHDCVSGVTTRVSIDSSGVQGNAASGGDVAISDDGRYVSFTSVATNLVAGDTNGLGDIFLRDRTAGTTTRVSVDSAGAEGNGVSSYHAISSDARYIAFYSSATNLVALDLNGTPDIFLRDRTAGTTTRVSVNSLGLDSVAGAGLIPAISADGRFVTFWSSANDLVAGDTNGVSDIFVRDMSMGITTRVSRSTAGVQGNFGSYSPSISSDGVLVAFTSEANNLVAGDTNGVGDMFVHDRGTGTTTRVSVDSLGAQGNGYTGYFNTISANGRFVAFHSTASNIVPSDTNSVEDIFLRDRLTSTTTRVSIDSMSTQSNSDSIYQAVSADGRYIAFWSDASNLVPGDTNAVPDIFVHDRGVATAFIAYCFGDGTDTTCPCGNPGLAGRGCNNAVASGGAGLTSSGFANISGDTLVLNGNNAIPGGPGLYFQGSTTVNPAAPFGVAFGNGVRCAAGVTPRLEIRPTADGTGASSTTVKIHIQGATLAGTTYAYQLWYRDQPNFGLCTSGFNVSNAINLTWVP